MTRSGFSASTPACRAYGSLSDQVDGNAVRQLPTEQSGSMLDPCGYTLTLRAYDRAIVYSNGAVVHQASKAVVFCVEGPADE